MYYTMNLVLLQLSTTRKKTFKKLQVSVKKGILPPEGIPDAAKVRLTFKKNTAVDVMRIRRVVIRGCEAIN